MRKLAVVAVAVVSAVLVPSVFLLVVTGPVFLRAFTAVTLSPPVQIIVTSFSWILAFMVLAWSFAAAVGEDGDPVDAVILVPAISVLLLIVPTAFFTWNAVTDRAYEKHGGVASCVVTDVEEHTVQIPMVGSIHATTTTYTYMIDCDVPTLRKWETDDVQLAEGNELRLEFDATNRFESRRYEPHRPWQSSAWTAFYLWLTMPVLQLVALGWLAVRRRDGCWD